VVLVHIELPHFLLYLLLKVHHNFHLVLKVPLMFMVFPRERRASWTSLLPESMLVSMLAVKMLRIFMSQINGWPKSNI
jgi:hypothetical protein